MPYVAGIVLSSGDTGARTSSHGPLSELLLFAHPPSLLLPTEPLFSLGKTSFPCSDCVF